MNNTQGSTISTSSISTSSSTTSSLLPPFITFVNDMGRTGNNVFQYMTCKLLSHLYGNNHIYVSIDMLSNNDKKNVFYIKDENINHYINNPPSNISNINIICDGYFQISDLFVPYREELLKIMYDVNNHDYWVRNGKREYINNIMNSNHKFNDIKDDDIVISLRLDDFIQLPDPKSDIVPPQYYTDIIENYGKFNRLFIVCDHIKYSWETNYLQFFNKWDPILIQESLEHDCALLREAPVLLHSNSTLCWIMSFFSLNNNKKRFIPKTFHYTNQSLNKIQDSDIISHVKTLSHNDVFTININKYLLKNIHRLSYCIPDECLENIPIKKTQLFSSFTPGITRNTYKYGHTQEREYYQQYKDAYFGYTQKKGGWDCLRHYEILANRCIPIFDNLENCPVDTLTTFPKSLVLEAQRKLLPYKNNNEEKYNIYIEKIMSHVREHCTTSATANYFLKELGLNNSNKNILLIRGDVGVNYTRETLWIGLKRHIQSINGIAVEYPKIDFLYDSFPEEDKKYLYGNGFTYSKRIKDDNINLTETEIINKIKSNFWDLIIYGKVGPDENVEGSHPNMPLWNHVFKQYNKDRIVFLYGGDECIDLTYDNKYKQHIQYHSQFGHCFVRELCISK
jgi:hypothetical protein